MKKRERDRQREREQYKEVEKQTQNNSFKFMVTYILYENWNEIINEMKYKL